VDNLTHTLVGALVGETIARAASASASTLGRDVRRDLIVGAMAIGGNLPDLDFLYSAVYGGKLDYLLHHRGHTHTIIGAVLTGALLWLALMLWVRKEQRSANRTDRVVLFATALLAPSLHVAMDYANNYGVHPFWPLDNRWYYGDSVFIIEPLLWAACAPLVFTFRSLLARSVVLLTLAAGVALAFFSGMVPAPNASLLAALTLALLLLARYARPIIGLGSGVALWLGTTFMFATMSETAAAHVDAAAARRFPGEALIERVVTPMPVNPLCWEVILIQRAQDSVFLRRAMLSLSPASLSAEGCRSRSLDVETTVPLRDVEIADDAQLKWYGQTSFSRKRLTQLAALDCRVAAFLQFARAPWLAATPAGTVLGDMRYDREPDLGFAEIALDDAAHACPRHVPPWIPPRTDFLPD
jgi:inner membrane protein